MLYQDEHGGDDVVDDNLDFSFLLEDTKVACVDVPKVVDAEAVHVVVAQVVLVIKDDHHQSKLSHSINHSIQSGKTVVFRSPTVLFYNEYDFIIRSMLKMS